MSPRPWRDGFLYTLSLAPSYLAFGAVCGVSAKHAGMSLTQALILPAVVFGGSSQVVLTALIIAGAPLFVVILSAVVVNSRMAIYSALFSQWLRGSGSGLRARIALLVVDQTYAAALSYREKHGTASKAWLTYYFVTGLSLWVYWVTTNVIGYAAGQFLPTSWQLEFAVPLSFVAVLAPLTRKLPMALATVLGALLSVLLFTLPLKLGLVASVFIGVSIMLVLDAKFKWTPPPSGSQS